MADPRSLGYGGSVYLGTIELFQWKIVNPDRAQGQRQIRFAYVWQAWLLSSLPISIARPDSAPHGRGGRRKERNAAGYLAWLEQRLLPVHSQAELIDDLQKSFVVDI